MTDQDLWYHIEQFGAIQSLWWYTIAVIPAMLASLGVYVLVWFTLARRRDRLTTMLLWLVAASLPALLVLPSIYARLAFGDTLAAIGLERPAVVQDLGFETTQQVGRYLDQLAWLGITGILLAIVLSVTNLFRLGFRYTPPLHQPTEAVYTASDRHYRFDEATQVLEKRSPPRVSAPYGVIRVVNGQRRGTHFGIASSVIIGRQQANLTINDSFVSRHHARIEVLDESAYLSDLNSINGTYLRDSNSAELRKVSEQPVKLRSGDVIFLGRPGTSEVVELIYERAQEEDQDAPPPQPIKQQAPDRSGVP
jgi:hypothetical protein